MVHMDLLVFYIPPGNGIFQGSDPDHLIRAQLLLGHGQDRIGSYRGFRTVIMPVVRTMCLRYRGGLLFWGGPYKKISAGCQQQGYSNGYYLRLFHSGLLSGKGRTKSHG